MITVEEEFRHKGVIRGGELMLRPLDAIDFVRRCRDRDIEVLGVDGFHLTPTTIQPDLNQSIDLSRLEDWRSDVTSWDRAEAFLAQRVASDLFYKVIADEV